MNIVLGGTWRIANWWTVALRGVAALVFGILNFFWPGITLRVLVVLFGSYVLVDGVTSLVTSTRRMRHRSAWLWSLLRGLVGTAVGIITFTWPHLTAFVLLFVIASWALVTGIFEIKAGIQLHREMRNEWLLILAGVLSIAFGVLLFARPQHGAVALVQWIAVYGVVFGIVQLALASRLFTWQQQHAAPFPAADPDKGAAAS